VVIQETAHCVCQGGDVAWRYQNPMSAVGDRLGKTPDARRYNWSPIRKRETKDAARLDLAVRQDGDCVGAEQAAYFLVAHEPWLDRYARCHHELLGARDPSLAVDATLRSEQARCESHVRNCALFTEGTAETAAQTCMLEPRNL
jgi:hypothetical protein